jgi:hypothetical protein
MDNKIKTLIRLANNLDDMGFYCEADNISDLSHRFAAILEKITFEDALKHFRDRKVAGDDSSAIDIYNWFKENNPENLLKEVMIAGNTILSKQTQDVLMEFSPNNIREIQETSDWDINSNYFPYCEQVTSKIESLIESDFMNLVSGLLRNDVQGLQDKLTMGIPAILNDTGITDNGVSQIIIQNAFHAFLTSVTTMDNINIITELQRYSSEPVDEPNVVQTNIENMIKKLKQNVMDNFDSIVGSMIFVLFKKHDEQLNSVDMALKGHTNF